MNSKILWSGFVSLVVMSLPIQALADSGVLAKSNQVQVTGGYYQRYSTQAYRQVGSTSRFVQTGTQQVYAGTTTETQTKAINHATYYATFYPWQYNNGHPIAAHYGPPGHYGAPYWNTYETYTVTVPVYRTEPVGYYTSVPVYGWVTVQNERWIPATVIGN